MDRILCIDYWSPNWRFSWLYIVLYSVYLYSEYSIIGHSIIRQLWNLTLFLETTPISTHWKIIRKTLFDCKCHRLFIEYSLYCYLYIYCIPVFFCTFTNLCTNLRYCPSLFGPFGHLLKQLKDYSTKGFRVIREHSELMASDKSFINTAIRRGPRAHPYSTLLQTGVQFETDSTMTTRCNLFLRKHWIQLSKRPSIP